MTTRIMHVMAGGNVGGAENIFLEDILALADAKELTQYVVTRPAPHRLKKLQEKNIPVSTVSFSKWWPFPTRRAIDKAIAEFKPDIVQYWMSRAGQFVTVGKHRNVAWHGGYYRYKLPQFAHHITLTRDLHRRVIEKGVDPKQVTILHTMAAFPGVVVPQSRAELDTPQDAVVLLALARLHWKKGLDVLLKALVDLPKCVAWIAGEGPLKGNLKKLADDLGVSSRVRFLGWRDDREKLLAAADICVFPSRSEPFGTMMIDAWAMKIPLIATDTKGPKAYIRKGENGILIPKDNVQALVTAVQDVISDKNLAEKIVAGGWEDYQAHFTKDAFLRASLALYKDLAGK